MKKVILLLSFLIFQNVIGQDDFEQIKSYLGTIEKVEEMSTLKNKKFSKFETLVMTDILERKLDFRYMHHRFLMLPVVGRELRINIISRNDSIIHGWVSKYNPTRKEHSNLQLFKSSSMTINTYVLNHNEFYGSDLTEKDFEEQIVTEYLVGFGCGFTGRHISPKTRESMKWVKKKKKRELNRFLVSFSPELQTLGALGLSKIGKVSEDQTRIICHLEKRNSVINSCLGCIYGIGETFSERLRR